MEGAPWVDMYLFPQAVGLLKADEEQHSFINAVLHALVAVPSFTECLEHLQWTATDTLVGAIAALLHNMQTAKEVVSAEWIETRLHRLFPVR